tara:strand:+ start:883 stop:1716 length:834 start_codon:yes stop_codon:yes gene_type:complete
MLSALNNIKNSFKKNNIQFLVLKGPALSLLGLYELRERQYRDLDIYVKDKNLIEAFQIFQNIGFSYMNKKSENIAKFKQDKHHLPRLINDQGVIVELHYRITSPRTFKRCPLTYNFFENTIVKEGYEIPSIKNLMLHCLYHGVVEDKKTNGPVYIFDLYRLYNFNKKTWPEFGEEIESLGLVDEIKKISAVFKKIEQTEEIPIENVKKLALLAQAAKWVNNDKKKSKTIFNKIYDLFFTKRLIRKINDVMHDYQIHYTSPKFYGFFFNEVLKSLTRE